MCTWNVTQKLGEQGQISEILKEGLFFDKLMHEKSLLQN